MQVRILKPTKSNTQSGIKKTTNWVVEFVKKTNSGFKESLMGRTSASDMGNELRMEFKQLEDALRFVENANYEYEIIEPKTTKIKPKNYTSNFK